MRHEAGILKRSHCVVEIESRFFEVHFKHRCLGDAHSQPLTGSALQASQALEIKRTRSKGIDRSRQHLCWTQERAPVTPDPQQLRS